MSFEWAVEQKCSPIEMPREVLLSAYLPGIRTSILRPYDRKELNSARNLNEHEKETPLGISG